MSDDPISWADVANYIHLDRAEEEQAKFEPFPVNWGHRHCERSEAIHASANAEFRDFPSISEGWIASLRSR